MCGNYLFLFLLRDSLRGSVVTVAFFFSKCRVIDICRVYLFEGTLAMSRIYTFCVFDLQVIEHIWVGRVGWEVWLM